ncbi:MAG: Exodeoxyribonuclease III [Alphaproteobacteria bacterium MarineAlpha2_Bin1]|nr:MAG: Exodeoxyribonuclease III [Alphaproteobacteria bacterium MarineAlpha2_Bin1]
MKIATWNINSIRIRVNQVIDILLKENIDILCLQETKVSNDLFPRKLFNDKGYEFICVNGQKQYNGVAIISRVPLDNTYSKDFSAKEEKRHISITLKNGIEIHNFYFPAGGIEPDVKTNIKFAEKLEFYNKVTCWVKSKKNKKKLILVGDMNVAPTPQDVWSHEKLINIVSHTPIEIKYYNALYKSLNWVDAVRYIMGEKKKIFTWWSYRSSDWEKANKGRRLDHIWVEKSLSKKIKKLKVLNKIRNNEKPSDHIPIILELKS